MSPRCELCGEPFSPKGLAIHVGMRHRDRPPSRREMEAAVLDLYVLMPLERLDLVREGTERVIEYARLRGGQE